MTFTLGALSLGALGPPGKSQPLQFPLVRDALTSTLTFGSASPLVSIFGELLIDGELAEASGSSGTAIGVSLVSCWVREVRQLSISKPVGEGLSALPALWMLLCQGARLAIIALMKLVLKGFMKQEQTFCN